MKQLKFLFLALAVALMGISLTACVGNIKNSTATATESSFASAPEQVSEEAV